MIHKKIVLGMICFYSSALLSVSVLDMKTNTSFPLLYKMMEVEKPGRATYCSIAPFGSGQLDSTHMAEALTMNGKPYFTLDEDASKRTSKTVPADMDPVIIGLTDHINRLVGHHAGGYNSKVKLSPQLKTYGVLLHFYTRCQKYFFDVRSAVLGCKTQVKITEERENDGAWRSIKTFEDAMTQSDMLYGKMGTVQKKFGVDNIQIKLGRLKHLEKNDDHDNCFAYYLVAEIPTGRGTKAEWVFEPRVGKNHFGIGVGLEEYYTNENNRFMIGVNYRYLFGAKEKRSFDLTNNGAWSRYLRVIEIPTIGNRSSLGINSLTLDAKVTPGHQVNNYVRWARTWDNYHCEIGYNFLYRQQEKISDIADLASAVGIFSFSRGSNFTTSTAKINTFLADADASAVAITPADLDKSSAAVGALLVSSVSVRFERIGEKLRAGIGGAFDGAHSKGAYASWNVWANLGCVF